jgi:hypothetical protein
MCQMAISFFHIKNPVNRRSKISLRRAKKSVTQVGSNLDPQFYMGFLELNPKWPKCVHARARNETDAPRFCYPCHQF